MASVLKLNRRAYKLRQENPVAAFFVNAFLIFFAVVSLVPMIWLLLAPTKTDADLSNKNPLMFGSLTGYLDAWKNLQFFDDGVIAKWAWNSIWYTSSIVVIATITASLAGFVLTAFLKSKRLQYFISVSMTESMKESL